MADRAMVHFEIQCCVAAYPCSAVGACPLWAVERRHANSRISTERKENGISKPTPTKKHVTANAKSMLAHGMRFLLHVTLFSHHILFYYRTHSF